jgi:hypothetical protein
VRYSIHMMQLTPPARVGQRITLLGMGPDPHPVPPWSTGTVLDVRHVLGQWHVAVQWDSGRTLSLVASVDQWIVNGEAPVKV